MPKQSSDKSRSFEESLADLEALVDAMENDQLPLEELVAHYEKGAGLLRHCEEVLASARKRIELIEITPPAEKELAQEPGSADDPQDNGATDSPADVDDDIRLL